MPRANVSLGIEPNMASNFTQMPPCLQQVLNGTPLNFLDGKYTCHIIPLTTVENLNNSFWLTFFFLSLEAVNAT